MLMKNPVVVLPVHRSDFPIPHCPDWRKYRSVELTLDIKSSKSKDSKQVQVSEICPFCDQFLGPRNEEWFESLPQTTFNTLPELLSRCWANSKEQPRDTNPEGRTVHNKELVHLACSQHQYESLILPLSVQYEWPRSIDFNVLLKRVSKENINGVIKRVYKAPWTSILIKAPAPETYNIEQLVEAFKLSPLNSAGYYGQRGWSIINRYAQLMLPKLEEETKIPCSNFTNLDKFTELIVVPEVTCELIMEDYGCSRVEAAIMKWISEPFGEKEYPYDDHCSALHKLHLQGAKNFLSTIEVPEEYKEQKLKSTKPSKKAQASARNAGQRAAIPPPNHPMTMRHRSKAA